MEVAQSIAGLWAQLLIAAAIILFASNYLAKSADIIAIKTGLGRSFIGVVMLATATSLPELGLGISSITLVNAPDLAVGDAFGSNVFNLLIIGILDLFWRNGPILNSVGRSPAMIAALGILIISITLLAAFIHTHTGSALSDWFISPLTIAMFVAFAVSMYVIYLNGNGNGNGASHHVPEPQERDYAETSLSRSFGIYAAAAAVIALSAIWLAASGEGIAHAMGWQASFVGTQFLALSTSLPELAASFAALRINAPDLAISNVLGSNLFNMGFILMVDDFAVGGKPLWAAVSDIHEMTATFAILMSAIIIIGILSRGRPRLPHKFITYESILLIGIYLITSVLVFSLS